MPFSYIELLDNIASYVHAESKHFKQLIVAVIKMAKRTDSTVHMAHCQQGVGRIASYALIHHYCELNLPCCGRTSDGRERAISTVRIAVRGRNMVAINAISSTRYKF